MSNSTRGTTAVLASLFLWGMFPLYLRPLHDVATLEVIAHRVVWSCVLILLWMLVRGEIRSLRTPLTNPSLLWRLTATAILITVNWLTYVYAVSHGQVLEASLGYFINPLLNVLLGVVFLSERLNRVQWVSVALAALAVVYMTLLAGRPPWISLAVAVSFGLYGFIRKVIAVEALPGLAVETLLLMPIGAAYLIWRQRTGLGAMGHSSGATSWLLIGSGAYTALPLFLYSYGARLIPYSTVGLLQYINPSLQMLCGLFVFGESFGHVRAVGFALIWAALAIYIADQMRPVRTAKTLQ